MAPQLMATNGGVAPLDGAPRREKYSRWIACAASSLPVPVSPSINTAAVMLVVLAQPRQAGEQSHYLAGIALALGAAFFYALMALAAKRLKGTPPHLIALIQVTVGAVMLLPLVDFHVSASVGQWGMLATLGVLHTGLMYVLMYGALQKLPTNLIGSLSFIYPIAAMLVDRLAFGHRLSAWQLLGAAIILLAAAGMNLLGDRRARLLPASDGRRAG